MGRKGDRMAEAIAERMGWLAFLFDGLYPSQTVPVLGVHALVPDCHLNQSRGGLENGPPTKPTKGVAAE